MNLSYVLMLRIDLALERPFHFVRSISYVNAIRFQTMRSGLQTPIDLI